MDYINCKLGNDIKTQTLSFWKNVCFKNIYTSHHSSINTYCIDLDYLTLLPPATAEFLMHFYPLPYLKQGPAIISIENVY